MSDKLWSIEELEEYFSKVHIPNEKTKLTEWETIINPKEFLESHLLGAKGKKGSVVFESNIRRLRLFRLRLEEINNTKKEENESKD